VDCAARIRAENGDVMPSYHAGLGGSAVLALAHAIEAAGSVDPAAVRDAVRAAKIQTCFGPFDVDATTGLQLAMRTQTLQWQTPASNPALSGPELRIVAPELNATDTFVYPLP